MIYCSYETRKVVDKLEEYGVVILDAFDIEIEVGMFWNTHIQQIIEQVLQGGDVEKKLKKIDEEGWAYFRKPIRSILTPRGGAHRTDLISIHLHARPIYNAVANGFVRADFNMKELALLCDDIPNMVRDTLDLSNSMRAAGENRSIYYLHGIVRREHQTRQGRIREIQQKTDANADKGWTVDPNFDKVDVIDRLELANDWQDRLNNIQINRAL